MSEPDKHHYLPVFYLNRWGSLDGKVTRYYRPHGPVVATPIMPANTGFERGLYRLQGRTDGSQNAIEKQFMASVVDSPAAVAIQILIGRKQDQLTSEQRRDWVRFLMSLHVRSPEKVQHIVDEASRGLREALAENPKDYQAIRKSHHPPTLVEWAEQEAPELLTNFGMQLLPGIVTHEPTALELLKMRWWTHRVADSAPSLLTCDRPVYLSHGVQDAQCLVAVPLSPRDAFFACRSEAIFERVMNRPGKDVARAINESMVSQAVRFVYGADGTHLRFVENRLRTAS